MLKLKFLRLFSLFLIYIANLYSNSEMKLYFASIADTEHYQWLCTQIASIYKYDQERLGAIAIFDLGFTQEERAHLASLPFVTVYDLEPVNPYLKTQFVVRSSGFTRRGWYSWKPVVLKMALDLFPYVLYMDAGMRLLHSAEPIFKHIIENGYFLIQSHEIDVMTTKWVIDKFQLNTPEKSWILGAIGISAGLQGVSRAVYNSYVYPMYELAYDIRNFEDDGTCPRGFGFGRHDQPLFSIMAKQLGFEIMGGPFLPLKIGNGEIKKIKLDEYIGFKPG